MNNLPLELFLSDEVQSLLDDFAALLDVRVTFFSVTGEYLRRGKAMRNCDYCQLVQTALHGWDQCVSMDNDKRMEALDKAQIINYRCHAGLHECLAPVWIRGVAAGFVMFGQFRLAGDTMPPWQDADAALQAKLRSSYEALPCFTVEKLNAVLGMLRTLIDYIAVRELAVLHGDRLREKIDNYIAKHATEDIRLPDMAHKLGKSVSTISQFLRRNYNTSFKDMLVETRLNLAEQFWRTSPGATVAEVAFASGFKDQFYFSRVFRRRRGMPPAQFRDSMRLLPAKDGGRGIVDGGIPQD